MTGKGSCQPEERGCGSSSLNISTQKLGDLFINKENIIVFKEGLFGFESLKEFVIINIEECRPFEWLVSVENPEITFPVINPIPFFTDYQPMQQIEDLAVLETKDPKCIETFCIVTLGDKPENATVNLKGPILINTQNKLGKQFVLLEDYYSLNHPLVKK
ncbi:MAG: flagellar assembly protein FliW [Planctomycetes bacterium]|nr:flagellar assembly protein FliW [Planctomycetota bacterium]